VPRNEALTFFMVYIMHIRQTITGGEKEPFTILVDGKNNDELKPVWISEISAAVNSSRPSIGRIT
jgi:hypothetical protein